MRYMLLIYTQEEAVAQMSAAEHARVQAGHRAVMTETTSRGILAGAEPLMPTSTATTVRHKEGKLVVTDGPFAETKEQLAGYYLPAGFQEVTSNIVLLLVLILYIMVSGPTLAAGAIWLIPPERRRAVERLLPRIIPVLRRYLVGICGVVAYTAVVGWIPKISTSSGVINEPPPTPVMPTRAPTTKPDKMTGAIPQSISRPYNCKLLVSKRL